MLMTVKAGKYGILSALLTLYFRVDLSIPSSAKHGLMHVFGNELHRLFLCLNSILFRIS